MTTKERDNLIHHAGRKLAEQLGRFFGSVQFNLQGGVYVNANIEQSLRPEKQENGK